MSGRILVATDGSRPAERAVAVAADLARARDAELVLLCVRENWNLSNEARRMAEVEHLADQAGPDTYIGIANRPTWMEQGAKSARRAEEDQRVVSRLSENAVRFGAETARLLGVPNIRTRIEDGLPAPMIVNVAREEACDLVIMGSRGLGNVARLMQGSVAARVAADAPCPCITVT